MPQKFHLNLLIALLLLVLSDTVVFAQATRTWVSGVGDDANPCSRTAPCKTFAGAISKTAAGGEINAIDPGGYGAVTITKSITINGGGTFASILASGTTGVIVNAGANDEVTLRNLSINGAGTGLNGIRLIAGGVLHVENCDIFGFGAGNALGIDFEPSGNSQLFVLDTVIRENTTGAAGGGVFIKSSAGTVKASFDKVRLLSNFYGVRAENISLVTIRDSVSSGNTRNGFLAVSSGTGVQVNIESSAATNNGTNGVATSGAAATILISNVAIMNNNQGINTSAGGNVYSFGNNKIAGNVIDGAPSGVLGQQ